MEKLLRYKKQVVILAVLLIVLIVFSGIYILNTTLNNIEVYEVDDGRGLIASIEYTVKDGSFSNTYKLITKL